MAIPLLLANLCATGVLIGLIWTIQLVHYPLLAAVGTDAFPAYLAEHADRITFLVAPWMLLELVTSAALVRTHPAAVPRWMVRWGLALCLAAWAATWFVSVPIHQALADGFDPVLHRRLVDTNWLRTALWTARGTLSLLMVWRLTVPVARPENA